MNGRMIRQTLTVARRDFVATVFTPTFLIFLLAPLFMLSFGLLGSMGATSMAGSAEGSARIVAIAGGDDGRALIAADSELRALYRRREGPPGLLIIAPDADPARQAHSVFADKGVETTALMYGPLDRPQLFYRPISERHGEYLARLAEEVVRDRRAGADKAALSQPTMTRVTQPRAGVSARGEGQAAFFAVFGMFMLTLMLAGQAVGTMAEERSNKVIEILAAAVPLESVFLGKLIGMFGVAILFVAFWGTIAVNVGMLLPPGAARVFMEIAPATGPVFPLLFFAYFTMAYMLLGAVFLSIGAQASTPREIQMLSLPITIFQVAMFGLSQAAAAQPDSMIARAAEVFPFSSPFAMAARAANKPELWPHVLALGWQLLWVALTIFIGARLFRRGVLQSGSPKLSLWRRRKAVGAA